MMSGQLAAARQVNDRLRTRLDSAALEDPALLGRHLDRAYELREHVELIGRTIAEADRGGVKRLMFTVPPQSGKSTTAATWAPFWWLIKHPRHRVAVASYAGELAEGRGKDVLALVEQHGARYGLQLHPRRRASHNWRLTSGGGMRCVGIDGGLTGVDVDLMIIDDPHAGIQDAGSVAKRRHVREFYTGTVIPRMQPGGVIIIIQTRWHPLDLTGWLLKEQGLVEDGGIWKLVHMPAIAVPPNPARWVPLDALGRQPGEPLPHPKVARGDRAALLEHWHGKRVEGGAREFNALYQGDPQPAEGALLSWDIIAARRDHLSQVGPMRRAVAVDPSGGGRDTAGIIAGFLGEDRKLYFTHDRSGEMSSDEWGRQACLLAYEIEAGTIIVETNYGGDMATRTIRTSWDALQREAEIPRGTLPPYIKVVRAKTGKLLRAEPIAQQWIEDNIRTAAPLTELETEWATWQPDDSMSPGRIDASVYLAFHLLPIPGAAAVMSTAADASKTQVSPPTTGLAGRRITQPKGRRGAADLGIE